MRPFVFRANDVATPGRMGVEELAVSPRSPKHSPFSPKALYARAIRSPLSPRSPNVAASPVSSPPLPPLPLEAFGPRLVTPSRDSAVDPQVPPNSEVSDSPPFSNLTPIRRRLVPSRNNTPSPSSSPFSPSKLLSRLSPIKRPPPPSPLTDTPPLRIAKRTERDVEPESPPDYRTASYIAHSQAYATAFKSLGPPRVPPQPPKEDRHFSGPVEVDENDSLLSAQEIEWALAM